MCVCVCVGGGVVVRSVAPVLDRVRQSPAVSFSPLLNVLARRQELTVQKEMVNQLIARQNALRERRGKVVSLQAFDADCR